MFDDQQPPARSPATKGMTNKPKKVSSEIEADGLRYRNKPAGSPFVNHAGGFGSTMSCFKCGKHRPSAELESKKLLGKSQKVCKGGCAK